VADQTSTSPDPLAAWREWVSQSERQWNAFLNEAMATEAYGQSVGRFMEMYVAMQKSMADAMGRYVTALNLPARSDVLALGDRLGAIENRLAGIEQRLAQLSGPAQPQASRAIQSSGPAQPQANRAIQSSGPAQPQASRAIQSSGPAPRAEEPAVDPLRPPRTKRPPGL